MGRTRTSDGQDHIFDNQESIRPQKRPRKPPPEPWQMPRFEPMHIRPMSDWHTVSTLPTHVNPARPWQIFNLFLTDELLETIARHTNEYAASHRIQPLQQFARAWKDTTPREILAYIATYIYTGLHKEADIAEYWNTDGAKGPLHPLVRRHISLVRWQQLDRFFHISKPKELQKSQERQERQERKEEVDKECLFDKIEPLNESLREAVKKYWNPTTHLAVDECIQRFQGRAKETVKIPSKPAPEGFKIWALANNGYILDWLYHAKGTGPVDVDSYWTEDRGFPATQAVVLDLLLRAGIYNDSRHVVWLDNLFTSVRLLTTLREEGFGAAGTVRTTKSKAELMAEEGPFSQETQQEASQQQEISQSNSQSPQKKKKKQQQQQQKKPQQESNCGLDPSLADLKTQHSSQIPWGKLYGCLSKDGKVLEFAWKDQNVVLFMSTVSKGDEFVKRLRKRPPITATNARTTRAVFSDEVLKELEIPEFIDLYNHFMSGVDQADQLRVYYNTQRVHLKSWKPLWHWLLDVAIVNSYKLSYHAGDLDLPCERYTKQRAFRKDLARELFDQSERLTTPICDTSVSLADLVYIAEEEEHTPYVKGNNCYCKACQYAGRKVIASEACIRKRKPLKELSGNSTRKGRRMGVTKPPRTRAGCELCGVPLCRTAECWQQHLQLVQAAIEAADR